jgi:hypothetical protein
MALNIINNVVQIENDMQSSHFHHAIVNNLNDHYFVEIGTMHSWACVEKISFVAKKFPKIDTKISLCFNRAMLIDQWWLEKANPLFID